MIVASFTGFSWERGEIILVFFSAIMRSPIAKFPFYRDKFAAVYYDKFPRFGQGVSDKILSQIIDDFPDELTNEYHGSVSSDKTAVSILTLWISSAAEKL